MITFFQQTSLIPLTPKGLNQSRRAFDKHGRQHSIFHPGKKAGTPSLTAVSKLKFLLLYILLISFSAFVILQQHVNPSYQIEDYVIEEFKDQFLKGSEFAEQQFNTSTEENIT